MSRDTREIALLATLVTVLIVSAIYFIGSDEGGRRQCQLKCAPHSVYSYSSSRCVCDLTKEVR